MEDWRYIAAHVEGTEFHEKLVELFRGDGEPSPSDVYDYQLGEQTVPAYILTRCHGRGQLKRWVSALSQQVAAAPSNVSCSRHVVHIVSHIFSSLQLAKEAHLAQLRQRKA
ncbi:unnamed protein product [Effrenium voratum]|nr:unnamed protein product [Effrenium voratum]